jgi:hypothetical protein
MALLPAGVSTLPLAAGRVLQDVVAPTLFVFVLFVGMLVAIGVTWKGRSPEHVGGPVERPPLARLASYLVVTAVAGYAIFLVIVAAFHVLIVGGPVSIIGDAASGGAFLAFVVALPVFLGLAVLSKRRLR